MGETEKQPVFTSGKLKGLRIVDADRDTLSWYYKKILAGDLLETYEVIKAITDKIGKNCPLGTASESPCRLSLGKYRKLPITKVRLSYLKWYYENVTEEENIRAEVAQLMGIEYKPKDYIDLMNQNAETLTVTGFYLDDTKF